MAKSVDLPNGRFWTTRKAAREHFRDIFGRYEDGTKISDPGDHDDLSALLERYDLLITDGPPKIGKGIAHFERRKTFDKGFPVRGFWVVRVDGTDTDFSYVDAVNGTPKPQAQEFYHACRNAVSEDLRREKERQFDRFSDDDRMIACDATGALVGFTNANLSHAFPSFLTLVNEFRMLRGWIDAIPEGTLSASADKQISTTFVDPRDVTAFKAHHHSRAILRIVTSGKGGPVKDPTAIRRPIRLA
ncbi:DCL family protein [Rhizobium leguminosarum]|uniref:DCL family protein n=1 Tax=Rhizobium leguminosarum TaxID=384 RepID=UPI001C951C97|nr:DCL family protein [Rhizobium leguminosarum]MBY5406523.1 DCL family protein [Rhizobium leguminosarum]